MKKRSIYFFAAVVFGLLLTSFNPYAAWKADDIVGEWYTENSKAVVKVYRSTSNHYYGRIISQKNPNESDGSPKLDKENPNPKLRNNPVVGLIILKAFRFDGEKWVDGTIYDPENGKTYKCTITMQDKNTLNVRGFIGISLIGRTTVWNRKVK